jgi:tetratricopeptide (TPR) repeat protein
MIHHTLVAGAVALLLGLPPAGAEAQSVPIEPAGSPAASAAQPQLDAALSALRAGNLPAAEQHFQAAVARDPQSAAGYLGMAEVAGRRGDQKTVEAWLRKGMAAAPDDPGLMHAVGVWHARHGRLSEAEKALTEAARLAPRAVTVLLSLGELYLARNETLDKAEARFREALSINAAFMPAHLGLARALAGRGQLSQAQAVLEEAAQSAPRDPRPLHAHARLLASHGQVDDAIQYHQRAIAVAPAFLPAYLDQGDLQLARHDIDAALATYRAGAAATGNAAPALFRLGVAYQAGQRWDEAQAAYLDTVAKDPQMFGAYNNLAVMAADRKTNLDQALTWAEKARQIAPGAGVVMDTLGWVHRARGDLSLALSALEQAARMSPRDPSVQYHLGVVYSELDRRAPATQAFKRALSLNPQFRQAADARERLQRLESM